MSQRIGERRQLQDGELLYRELTIERAAAASEGAIRVAISTDTEIIRQGWMADVWGETLGHGRDEVRLARLQDAGPLLLDHDRRMHIGVLERVKLEGRVIRADLRFSRAAHAQEVEADVRDGIRTKLSVGYLIWEVRLEAVDEDDVEHYRITDWEPLEASLVSIPADLGAGVGRSHDTTRITHTERRSAAVNSAHQPVAVATRGEIMSDRIPAMDVSRVREEAREAETTRVRTLTRLGQLHQRRTEEIDQWVREGTTVEQASRVILDEARAQPRRPTTPAAGAHELIDSMSSRDRQRYSVRRAIACLIGDEDAPLEREVSDALSRVPLPPGGKSRGGMRLPSIFAFGAHRLRRELSQVYTRDGLDTQTPTAGQELPFEEFAGLVEMLRTRMVALAMGAEYLPGLMGGDVSFVVQTAAAQAEWMAENPVAGVTDTELALALATLAAKTLMGSTFFSRQLFRQAIVPVDLLVENDLLQVHARAVDHAVLHGTGANNQPTGIYEADGVNAVSFAGAPSHEKLVEMETVIAAADGDVDRMGYVTTPGVRGALRRTRVLTDSTDSIVVWTGSVREGLVNGYRAMASNQVRSDLAADGIGTTPTPLTHHGIVFGDWATVKIGEWGVTELIADPYTNKKKGLIEITSFQMCDVVLAQAAKLSKALGVLLP